MRYLTHQFIFHRIYEMASLVEDCISNPESFEELAWYDSDVLKCLSEFSKTTLLHYYIADMIWTAEYNELIENDDIYEDSEGERAKLEATLRAYRIEYVPYSVFLSNLSPSEAEDLPFRQWFHSQEDGFDLL